MVSISISSTTIHVPEFQSSFFHSSPTRCKCSTIVMTMDSDSSLPMKNWKKKEASLQLSNPAAPLVHRVETSKFSDLRFDRLQPSDHELDQHKRFEFGQFVARESLFDEEYWTAAWLRSENLWEIGTCERHIDHYKRKFVDKEFNAIKRRCQAQNGESYACIITVRKEQKNVKRTILKSVVGTLDLSTRYLLLGETFPGERPKAPPFCSLIRTPSSRYGYIANLCVTKSARRQGIASNMLYFAVESAKSIGVARIYVHVDRNNRPAQTLYQNLGFEVIQLLVHLHFPHSLIGYFSSMNAKIQEASISLSLFQMVEMANSLLLNDQKYLLLLQT